MLHFPKENEAFLENNACNFLGDFLQFSQNLVLDFLLKKRSQEDDKYYKPNLSRKWKYLK
jgi:hypothetical protein